MISERGRLIAYLRIFRSRLRARRDRGIVGSKRQTVKGGDEWLRMLATNARLSFQRQTPAASFPINATIPCEWHHRDILLRARFLGPAILSYRISQVRRHRGTVRYAEFRKRLENALRDVGLFVHDADRVETINLADTVRHWKAYIRRSAPPSAEPFSVSAEISVLWTPFDAARSYTCEEDLYLQLVGRRRRQPPRTARRWTRVDLSLYANLPYGSTTSMPEPHVFAAWTSSIVEKAHAAFSEIEERNGHIVAVLGAPRGSPGGSPISGFRMVRVPRVWDDPGRREAEKGPARRKLARLARAFEAPLDE